MIKKFSLDNLKKVPISNSDFSMRLKSQDVLEELKEQFGESPQF